MAETKRKPGRPRLPYRTRPVSVRIKEEEYQMIVVLSKRLDTSVGEILRRYGVNKAVKVFAKQEKETVNQ